MYVVSRNKTDAQESVITDKSYVFIVFWGNTAKQYMASAITVLPEIQTSFYINKSEG